MLRMLITNLIQKSKKMITLFLICTFVFIGWHLISAFNTSDSIKIPITPPKKIISVKKIVQSFNPDSLHLLELKKQTEKDSSIWVNTWKKTTENAVKASDKNIYLENLLDSILNNEMASDYFTPAKN